MVDLLKQEMNKKNRIIFGCMALFLFVVTILMAIIGKDTKTLDGLKLMNSFGGVTTLVETLITIIVATRFAGVDSNKQIRENIANHHSKTGIFFTKVLTCAVAYLLLLVIATVAIIMMKYLIFTDMTFAGRLELELQWSVLGNIAYTLIFESFVMLVIGFCKTWYGAIAFGIACTYITEIIAGIFMIFIYVHRELIYNPFNFFFVEKQIQDGMKHMMTRLTLNQIIAGSILYTIVFFVLAYIIFVFVRHFPTDEELVAKREAKKQKKQKIQNT